MGIVAWLLGVLLGFNGLWSYVDWIVPLACLQVILYYSYPRWRAIAWCFLFFCLGVFHAVAWDAYFQPQPLVGAQLGHPVFITADVLTHPIAMGRGQQRCRVRVRSLQGRVLSPKPLVDLRLSSPGIRIGGRYQWVVVLQALHPLRNFSFNNPRAVSAYASGLVAKGRTKSRGVLVDRAPWSTFFLRWRERVLQRLGRHLGADAMRGWVMAMSLGFTDQISQSDWQLLRETGTAHLMAISGLHVGLVAGMVAWIGRWVYRAWPVLTFFLPAPRLPMLLAVEGACFYALLAGFSLSTRRCLMMLLVYAGLQFRKRPPAPWRVLLISAFVESLLHPVSLLTMGFWLSYGAVAVIFLTHHGQRENGNWFFTAWRFNAMMWLGMLPMTAFFFHRVSLHAMLCNLIAVPWVSLLIMPLIAIGNVMVYFFAPLGRLLFQLALWQLHALHAWLVWMNQVWWHVPLPIHVLTWPKFVGVFMAVMVCLWPGRSRRWSLSALWLMPCLLPESHPLPQQGFELNILDVGQGLSALIRTQHHAMLVDAGWRWRGVDRGRDVVLPTLFAEGVRHLDRVLISHGDRDHAGGLDAVMAGVSVGEVWTSAKRLWLTHHAKPCVAGQHWVWDGVMFEMLWPDPHYHNQRDNNHSCVLRVCAGEHCALLPGDIEASAEKAMLRAPWASHLKASILLAPHHGSQSSSTLAWARLVNAKNIIYSTGYMNMYHFPHPLVMVRYQALGAKSFNTADTGALKWRVTRQGMAVYSTQSSQKYMRGIWYKK